MTGTEYNRAIVQHLGDSEKLIVVCSPGARASTLTMRFGALWKLTKPEISFLFCLRAFPTMQPRVARKSSWIFLQRSAQQPAIFFQKSTKSESLITEKLVACYAKSAYLNGKRKHQLVIPANAGIQKINSAYRFPPARE